MCHGEHTAATGQLHRRLPQLLCQLCLPCMGRTKFLELCLKLWSGVSERNVRHNSSLAQRQVELTTLRFLESCTSSETTR